MAAISCTWRALTHLRASLFLSETKAYYIDHTQGQLVICMSSDGQHEPSLRSVGDIRAVARVR